MKIELHTTFTPISTDKVVKPTAPMWRIENTGFAGMFIDNFYLEPGNDFGIDCTPVVAKLLSQGIEVESNTQFNIRFRNDLPSHYTKDATLIQTFVKVIK